MTFVLCVPPGAGLDSMPGRGCLRGVFNKDPLANGPFQLNAEGEPGGAPGTGEAEQGRGLATGVRTATGAHRAHPITP